VTYEERLIQIAERNADVVVMTAENRAAIRNLPGKLGSRFIDVGIAEQTLVGAAAGLALRGRVPIVHALATFLTMRAFEFIRTDVGIAQLPVKLVGAIAGFLSEANGPTHQAVEDLALMRGIPGMNVCCPADEPEMLDALTTMASDRAPWYMRYNARQSAFEHRAPFVPGIAEIVTEGADVALLTYGCLTRECYEATGRLADAGIGVRLVNMRTLKPIDEAAILKSARETTLVVTVEPSWGDQRVFQHYRARLRELYDSGAANPVMVARFRETNRTIETRLRQRMPHLIAQIDALYAETARDDR